MIQRGSGLGFALETAERLRITRNFVGQEFECDEAMEPLVFGLVDHSHPAATELFNDAVVRDGLANHGMGAMLGSVQGQVNERRGVGGISRELLE